MTPRKIKTRCVVLLLLLITATAFSFIKPSSVKALDADADNGCTFKFEKSNEPWDFSGVEPGKDYLTIVMTGDCPLQNGDESVFAYLKDTKYRFALNGQGPTFIGIPSENLESGANAAAFITDSSEATSNEGNRITVSNVGVAREFLNVSPPSNDAVEDDTHESGASQEEANSPDEEADQPSCDNDGGELSWLLCPALRLASNAIGALDQQIQDLLEVPNDYFQGESAAKLRETWVRLRNIAYIILIPIMLVMVIGTALGFSFIDAYTVKKALPRLVIATLFIALSYDLLRYFIIFINDVGAGVLGLMTSSFGEDNITLASLFDPGGVAGFSFTALLVGGTIAALGIIPVILSYAFVSAIALLVGFLALAFRQMLLIIFLVISPLAILAWIFPGNDKLWKLWWGSFSKLLYLYPLIMLMIGGGKVFAATVQAAPGSGLLETMLILAAYVAPYFFIPFAFKTAGGLFATITGMANDRSRGLFDRQRKFRQKKLSEAGHRLQGGTYFKHGKEGGLKEGINTRLQKASMIHRAGLRPSRMKGNLENAITETNWERGLEAAEKLPGAKAFFANDDAMLAALYGSGDFNKAWRYLKDEKGYSEDQARMVAAKGLELRNRMGSQAFSLAALAKLPGTGTAYKGEKGIESWLQDIDKHTGGNKSLAASIVAAGKSGFRSAQQYEYSEAGFGDMMNALDMVAGRKLKEDGSRYGEGEVGEHIANLAYKAVGASGIVNARNDDSAKVFARAAHRDLQAAVASGDKAAIGRSIAQIENIRDVSGTGKRTVTDTYIEELSRPDMVIRRADGSTANIVEFSQAVRARNDPEIMGAYYQVKHDYSAEAVGAHQAEQAAGATPGAPPTPPVGGGPGAHL